MKKILTSILLALSLVTAGLVASTPTYAHHGGDNQTWGSVFTLFCDASHRNFDDPITGANETSHLHQYFGSPQFQVPMPSEAAIESGASSCRFKGDTAGYWVPALLDSAGNPVNPPNGSQYFYYYCTPVSASCQTDAPIPDDLKVIWGTTVGDALNNSGGGGPFGPAGGWRCTGGAFHNRIRDCANGLQLEMTAPPCWDGVNLDSANHRSHMAFLTGSGTCPASHPVKLPMPHYFVNFPSLTQAATQGYRLSSDPATCDDPAGIASDTCGQTAHADFWNTWNQPKLEEFSNKCTIQHIDVGESVNDWGCRLLETNAWFPQTGNPDDGLVTNASFETGSLSGWTSQGSVVVNSAAKNTGNFGVQLNASAATSTWVKQTFSVTPGETVCTMANVYPNANYAAGQARTSIQGLSPNYPFVAISPQLSGQNGGGLGPGEFKHIWAQGVVPAGQTSVQVLYSVQAEADGVGTIFFDDLSFFRGPCPLPTQPPPSAPTVTGFSPGSGNVGQAVAVTGTSFTGATAVKFNGTNATFTVDSTTQISTSVPAGATDGTISVTTAGGTGTSAASFDVTTPATGLSQVAFRGRNDNGSETSATWKAAENVNWSQGVDVNFRARFVIDETSGTDPSAADYKVQYSKNGGAWTDVNSTSLVVRSSSSPNVANNTSTTRQLTAGSGLYRSGFVDTNNGAFGLIDMAPDEVTELEFSAQIRSVDVVNGDTIQFRVTRNTFGVLDTYSQIPTVTVVE